MCALPDSSGGVYADALEAGMHFPLHDFFRQVLRHFGLAPSQFTPNWWRIMAGFVLLCHNTGMEPPPLAVFCHFFALRARGGWYHFRPKDAAGGALLGAAEGQGLENTILLFDLTEVVADPRVLGRPPTKSSKSDPLLTNKEKTLAEKLLGTNFSAQ